MCAAKKYGHVRMYVLYVHAPEHTHARVRVRTYVRTYLHKTSWKPPHPRAGGPVPPAGVFRPSHIDNVTFHEQEVVRVVTIIGKRCAILCRQ